LLGDMALVLALWLASSRAFRPLVRAGGVVLAYGAIVAVVLTYSRAGIAVAALLVVAWAALSGRAFETVGALLLAGPAAAGVAAFALSLPGVADDGQSHAARVHDGRLFGAVFAAVAVGVLGLAAAAAGRQAPLRAVQRALVTAAVAAAVVAVGAVLAVGVARAGGPGEWLDARWDGFGHPETPGLTNQPTRLTSLSSNYRWEWWQEAWRAFLDAPATGQGAGSFYRWHRLEREQDVAVSQPHNVPLQLLSDTGIIGFLLLGGALAAGGAAVVSTIRRLQGGERAAALAVALSAAAYFVHWLVDYDWDFVAVTAPTMFMVGSLVRRGALVRARVGVAWAVGAAAVAVVAVSSLLAPWLAERKVSDAFAAVNRGQPEQAAADAKDAHRLNPLAIDPLLIWGLADTQGGNRRAAYDHYLEAVDTQPKNADAWFALGSFELKVLRAPRVARERLERARELDRFGGQGLIDDLLAQADAELARQRRG
jgi:O-antigen ligase